MPLKNIKIDLEVLNMNKKIIAASLLSTFAVSTISNTSAKNGKTERIVNVINNDPKVSFAVSTVVSFSLFSRIPRRQRGSGRASAHISLAFRRQVRCGCRIAGWPKSSMR